MKKLLLLLLLLMTTLLIDVVYSQTKDNIIQFEFSTGSRGYSKEIKIKEDSIFIKVFSNFIKEDNLDYKDMLTSQEWDSLVNSIKNLALDEVSRLEAPTNRSAYDGAYGSSITITISSGENWSHGFDNYDPHVKLKKLMLVIQEIENRRK